VQTHPPLSVEDLQLRERAHVRREEMAPVLDRGLVLDLVVGKSMHLLIQPSQPVASILATVLLGMLPAEV